MSLHSSNPMSCYLIIRLPRELKELTGRIANVYQTEIDGVQGFFIAPRLDKLDKYVENKERTNSPILAPACQKTNPKVLPPQLGASTSSKPPLGTSHCATVRQNAYQEAQNEAEGDTDLRLKTRATKIRSSSKNTEAR